MMLTAAMCAAVCTFSASRFLRSVVLMSVILLSTQLPAQELRYKFQQGQKFAWQVKAVAQVPGEVETLTGTVLYTVKATTADSTQLTFEGGLTKKTESRAGTAGAGAGSRPGAPRGFAGPGRGPGGPPRGPGGPMGFLSSPLSGLRRTTNQLSLTSTGEVLSLQGTSQLPYLLGNLSLLFFEPLPDTAMDNWIARNGVTIREGSNRSRPGFMRPSPFDEPEKMTAAEESSEYSITGGSGSLVEIQRIYQLSMPAQGDDVPAFQIRGQGTIVFDRNQGLPQSLNFEQELTVTRDNTSVRVPVTLEYKLLSAEELEHFVQQRDAAMAEQRQRAEDQRTGTARPLPADKKQQIIADLTSGKSPQVTQQLVQLKIMRPHPDDRDVALLIQEALKNAPNRPQRVMAEAAWGRWKVLVEGPEDEQAEMKSTGKQATNPFVPAKPAEKGLRTWTDNTGAFRLEAEFVSVEGTQVTLRREDGEEITLPLSRLSEADQKAVKKLTE